MAKRIKPIICCLLVLLIGGCATTQEEKKAERAVGDYEAGDYALAAKKLQPLAEKTDENFALNNLRLGSADLARYDLQGAEDAFLKAYEVLNSFGANNGGRTLGAVLVDEKIKIWRGEPFEKAMANFYLGVIYYIQHDYNNAMIWPGPILTPSPKLVLTWPPWQTTSETPRATSCSWSNLGMVRIGRPPSMARSWALRPRRMRSDLFQPLAWKWMAHG